MRDERNALNAGKLLESYKILRVLGTGAFGITYLVEEVQSSNLFAIKEYFPSNCAVRLPSGMVVESESDGTRGFFQFGLAQFINEAKVLAQLSHPNIIAVRRYFKAVGSAYIVMDYCDGTSLSDVLKNRGTMNVDGLRRILFPLVDALSYLHKFGILHRDIKPANIYINARGSPILLDFGAARLQLSATNGNGFLQVTDGFAPPEQYASQGVAGPWSDLYSLGCTCYFALMGVAPKPANQRMLLDRVSLLRDRNDSHLHSSVFDLIDQCILLDPTKRPASAEVLKKELERIKFLPDADRPEGFRAEIRSSDDSKRELSKWDRPSKSKDGLRIFIWFCVVFILFAVFAFLFEDKGKVPSGDSPPRRMQIPIE